MSETIPEDIRIEARRLAAFPFDPSVGEVEATIARALLAERERCANIAASFSDGTKRLHPALAWDDMDGSIKYVAHWTSQEIAAAIRSDHTASMEAAAPGYLSRRRAIKEGE